jgi:hypothetical protein
LVLEQPRKAEELRWFVAQYGNGQAQAKNCDPTAVLLRAVAACRQDAGLARMLPVFVHRARAELFAEPRRLLTVSAEDACVLGFFLELTARLSAFDGPTALLRGLRKKSRRLKRPVALFKSELAVKRPSSLAASWKLEVGEPDESFQSYFAKVQNTADEPLRRMPSLGKRIRASL